MSTVEGGGIPASPEVQRAEVLGDISQFSETGERFRSLLQAVRLRPSDHGLNIVHSRLETIKNSALPFQRSSFFAETKDKRLIDSCLGTVMREAEENWKLATELNPNDPAAANFPEGLKDMLVTKIMEDEEDLEFLPHSIVVDINDLETLQWLPADALVYLVCNAHNMSVGDLHDNFMTCQEIVDYSFRQASRERRQERRQERIVTVGAATVGAFIGSSLAYIIAQRRRK